MKKKEENRSCVVSTSRQIAQGAFAKYTIYFAKIWQDSKKKS